MSAAAPRPKPWEVSSGTPSDTSPLTTVASTSPAIPGTTAQTSTELATIPEQSSLNNSGLNNTGLSSYSPYGGGMSGYGTGYNGMSSYGMGGGYGSYGGYGGGYGSSYGSGGYGGGMYGGYGSYGSPYSRFGGGMYGGGMMNGPGNFESNTAATFQLIESIVGAFSGFAQMLESTYMATHSSFFAMVSVAEQIGHLKNTLGKVLGIYAILRWIKKILAKIQGKELPPDEEMEGEGAQECAEHTENTDGSTDKSRMKREPLGSRPSYKPLVIFLSVVLGIPYLLSRAIKSIAEQNRIQQAQIQEHYGYQPQMTPVGNDHPLEFCTALYDFIPENPQIEIELHKHDLLAIIAKEDPTGQPSQWWKVKTRDGRVGYIPSNYVQIVPNQLDKSTSDPPGFSVEEFQRMDQVTV
ncbi:hypothetical protein DV451_003812 [Geotrichum candidum]|uniref:Peroxisomal membrane protein PEX13 n=1 Tax=Geotrichum candidum TaxID=1173061 RepID=A0A9P5KSV3_GEOCN|nr:hypothetical protein DV451_003812 [Geotrichum candidum]